MNPQYNLVADIGGTNIRFATSTDDCYQLEDIQTFSCKDFPTIEHAIQHYLANIDKTINQACLAVAAAITGDKIELINQQWSFSQTELQQNMQWQQLEIINDFTAIALSVPQLKDKHLMQVGIGKPVVNKAKGVIGPGTGLGTSGLVPQQNGNWIALSSEGGHVTAGGRTNREQAIIKLLQEKFGHVSWERLISGPGLFNIYQSICQLENKAIAYQLPQEISAKAVSAECPICEESLAIFCALLGHAAGDLALTLGAKGGIYLAGGILPLIKDFLPSSDFRKRFIDKGRLQSYLENIPTFLILAPYPGLLGARISLG